MRRYKNWAHKISSWKYLTIWRPVLPVFPWAQSASFLLSTLKGVLKISSCSSIWFNPCRGRWQLTIVVDTNVLMYQTTGFPGGTNGKEFTCQRGRHKRHEFHPWVWKIPWKWQPAPVFMPGKFQRQSNLYCFPNNFGGYFTGFQNLGTTTLGQWPGATCEQESLEMSPSAPRLVPTLSTHRLLNELCDTHKLSALWKRISTFWSIVVVPSLCNPWTAAHQASLAFHYLLEFAQTHVHWVGDAIQPSHPLLPPSPSALNLSQHQGLFQWISSLRQVTKVLELLLQH